MSSTSLTQPQAPTHLSWSEAHQRAQSRIADLANRRTAEARSTTSASLAALFSPVNNSRSTSFRVGQLDTELLDAELLELMKNQVWNGLKYFNPTIKESYEAELMALLRLALFKLTMWDHNATYGAALQNLSYADARSHGVIDLPPTWTQKSLYGLITVGGRYAWDKIQSSVLSSYDDSPSDTSRFTRRLPHLVDRLTTVHSIASFFSLLIFIANGRYRTLLDRILRIRLITPTRHISREVSFEYLNRQLVWHAFTEFLLFILPIVGIGRWRRWISRLYKKSVLLIRSSRGLSDDSDEPHTTGVLSFLPERTCAICYQESSVEDIANPSAAAAASINAHDITNPYEAVECGHVYCYVCIASKIELEEGEGWTCLRCGKTARRCRPWREGVVGLTTLDNNNAVSFDDPQSPLSPKHKSSKNNKDQTPQSPKEAHGLDDILESVSEDEDDDEQDDDDNLDPVNEDLDSSLIEEPVFAGGGALMEEEEDDDGMDSEDTEKGTYGGQYSDTEDDAAYDTADGGDNEDDEKPWERRR